MEVCFILIELEIIENHSSLLKLIEEATQRNSSHMVLVGDFNYPGIDWNNLTATSSN